MFNFGAIVPDIAFMIIFGIVLGIVTEGLLYFWVKNSIINKLGLPILLFAFFCSEATAFVAFALKTDQETFIASLVVILPVALCVFILLAFYLYITIYKPIKELDRVTKLLSEGTLAEFDLHPRSDELGQLEKSFEQMNKNFRSIIMQINSAINLLASSTDQLASSSEEVNASSEEISAITQRISQSAQIQNKKFNELIDLSNTLKTVFDEKINEINQTSMLIENLASQVNMLSLNASIEAARAGEYGRGFSVVADNIRRLADDSRSSVNKVQNTINTLRQTLASNISFLIESIDSVTALAHDTASGSQEASAATEEQAATMQEISASAQELATLTKNLEGTVNLFKLQN